MGKILTINNICKSFKDHQVLKNINIEIDRKGEIFGLIGVNGIGKTTLIKIILDLLNADQGAVEIFGLNSADNQSRANLAYLPEKFQPSQYLKGTEFLNIACQHFNKNYNHQEAIKLAEQLDLNPAALNERIGKYSKGMGLKLG